MSPVQAAEPADMTKRLDGKRALVTGAGSGIGRAISLAFGREGARVFASDIDPESARETAQLICADGGAAVGSQCDVSAPEAVHRTIASIQTAFGGLDVLVNNAAWFPPRAPLADIPEEIWDKCIAVNLHGPFLMSRAAIPVMAGGGGGSIIHIASQMAKVANFGQTPYCASKGALLGLARGIALDHAGDNIRCNTLSPGGIATEGMGALYGSLENAEKEWGIPMHPLGRLGQVEEVAAAAVFLASDESGFMTGADLVVDGGYTSR